LDAEEKNVMTDLHFLRPWWLLSIIPLLGLAVILWRRQPMLQAWSEVCDRHLLAHLIQTKDQSGRKSSIALLIFSALFVILGIAGPSWYQLPVATYKQIQPRVVVLDMSENMLQKDLTPNRLSRAKFKLSDLFARKGVGQFALIVFTGEPFIVSPLTDDGQTIASFLPVLTPDIMPVSGRNLDSALTEARKLIKDAGYEHGQVLVLTADAPSSSAASFAKELAYKGILTSIMPVTADKNISPLFARFAQSGGGQVVRYASDSSDLEQWLSQSDKTIALALSKEDDIPLWRDEGRWFFIPALIMLLPIFRRGWLMRVAV
jgi:Ca-activated chloride channel family protein